MPIKSYICKPPHIEYGAKLTYIQAFGYITSLVESGFLLKEKVSVLSNA
jgi:hypothetical protein